jgi:sodium-dependent phosphate cotransporter
VALVHTLFNLSGILLFYPIRVLRNLPLRLATGMSDIAAERRSTAIGYALGMFVVVPLLGVLLLR